MALSASKAKIGVIFLGFLGVLLLVLGIVALTFLPAIFKAKLKESLYLAEGKETYEKWKKTPIPVTFRVYLFNVTNPFDVIKGAKPHVEEIGPYTFQQMRSKDVLSWDKEEFTVTYRDLKRYFFVPEMSADINLKVYSLNMPLQGILMSFKKLSDFARSIILPSVEGILKNYNESLFSHRTAKELLFNGYKVDLIQDLTDIVSPFVTLPQILPNNTFGFLYGKNNSGDGAYEVFTGEDDIGKYSKITKWNNISSIPYWNDEYCNMLNGTDGSQFPPPITKGDVLHVYTADICRSVYFEFEKDVEVQGIPAYRFVIPEKVFACPVDQPENTCFYKEPENCEMSGFLEISSCKKGLKIAVTKPHFFQAHPFINERVSGLSASREAHDTYLDIEPTTGVVLRASKKLQMNFILHEYSEFEETKSIPMCILPLIWINEEVEINEKIASIFTAKVKTPVTVAKSVLIACIVLGTLWIVISGFVTVYIVAKEKKTAKAGTDSKYKVVPQKPDVTQS